MSFYDEKFNTRNKGVKLYLLKDVQKKNSAVNKIQSELTFGNYINNIFLFHLQFFF